MIFGSIPPGRSVPLTSRHKTPQDAQVKSLMSTLSCFSEAQALFNFLAELCWANYMCPSEHAIQRAMHCLLDAASALIECPGNSEPAGWYLYANMNEFFLARTHHEAQDRNYPATFGFWA